MSDHFVQSISGSACNDIFRLLLFMPFGILIYFMIINHIDFLLNFADQSHAFGV